MERYIEVIKKTARLKGITLKDLAAQVGMTEPGFHYSIKKNNLKFETVIKLCNALDLNPTDLFAPLNTQLEVITNGQKDEANTMDSLIKSNESLENVLKNVLTTLQSIDNKLTKR